MSRILYHTNFFIEARKVVLNNVPAITDTEFLLEYAVAAGAEIEYDRDKKKIIVYEKVKENLISTPMVVNCRSSLLVLAMHYMEFSTARMINAVGGCQLGERKIDQHIRLWNCLGAKVSIGHEISLVKEIESLHSFGFELDTTMGSICALYAMEKGLLRTADNISVRPEVLDLCNFLSCFGRRIKIIGNSAVVEEVRPLNQDRIEYTIPDDIDEAIGLASLCYANRISARILAQIPHTEAIDKLEMISNGDVTWHENELLVKGEGSVANPSSIIKIEAGAYPLIGSDQQPILSVLATLFNHKVEVMDNKFPNRSKYLGQLAKFGWETGRNADNYLTIIYEKKSEVPIVSFEATDIRAGFALLICGSCLADHFYISHFEQLMRGYSNIIPKIKTLGLTVRNISENEHKSVATVIRLKDKGILLQKRDEFIEKNPGKVTLFGGKVEAGESPAQAMKRELLEELNLHCEPRYFAEYAINEKNYSISGTVYVFELELSEPPAECLEGTMIIRDMSQAFQEPLTPFARSVLEELYHNKEH